MTPQQSAALAKQFLYAFPKFASNLKCPKHLKFIADKIQEKLEIKTDRFKLLMVSVPPRHGKPVDEESQVLMGDGSLKKLKYIKKGDTVITHTGKSKKVLNIYIQGELDCVNIETSSGRIASAALDHPYLTPEGWMNAGNIKEGMCLTSLANYNNKVLLQQEENLFEARLAGYFIGDGCCTNSDTSIFSNITCYDEIEYKDIENCINKLGFTKGKSRKKSSINIKNGSRNWLRKIGLGGHDSFTKRVPLFIFTGSNHLISNFIGAYFSCDGSINKRGNKRKDACVEFYSVNKLLLKDIQHLLLRLGIQSTLRLKNGKYKENKHISWRLSLTSQDDIRRFTQEIPIYSSKKEILNKWSYYRQTFDQKFITDRVVNIKKNIKRKCRCLNVKDDHTFIADDFIVHNTLLISKHAVPWFIGGNSDKHVILTSYSSDLSDQNSDFAKNIFARWGPTLWNAYPSKSLFNRDEWLTDKGGGVKSSGIGGGVTGFGADLFIIDDYFKNDKEAESEAERESLWSRWQSVVGSRLHPGSLVIILATRWNCLLPDNLIHIENGLKKIADLDIKKDKVLTSNGYESILNYGCKPYNGDIYKINIYGYPRYIAVTANHRLLTSNGWKRADEIVYEDYILFPKNKNETNEIRFKREDSPWLNIDKVKTKHINKITDNKLLYKIKNIKKEKYIGIVYDITTPSHEFCSENMIVHNSDDLIGRLVNQAAIEGDDFPFDWEYINLPAIASNNDPLGREPGEALWPDRYSVRLLKDIEKIVGPYWWASLYQGDPVKKGGNLFKSQNFRYYTREASTGNLLCWRVDEEEPLVVRKGDMKIATIVDPALEIKKKNDPCGMHTWGYSRKHKVWLLLDRFNDRIEHQKVNQIIKNFAFKGNANYILVENEKIGKIIVKNSAGKDKIGDKKIPFKEVPTKNEDKYLRAIPMASYCENQRVFFPKDAPWLAKFEKVLKDFPTGGHDEDADLTAYAATMEDTLSIAEILANYR